jgi:hypothetical protein
VKINVRDEINEAIFVLFDEQVKRLAFETCGVLVSIVSSYVPFFNIANVVLNFFKFDTSVLFFSFYRGELLAYILMRWMFYMGRQYFLKL